MSKRVKWYQEFGKQFKKDDKIMEVKMGRPKSKGPSIQLLRKKRRYVGKFIQDKRKEQGINQDKVASVLKYKDKQAVSNIERGVAPLPLNKIQKLAELLKVEPKVLAKLTLMDKEPTLFRDIEFVYHNDPEVLDANEIKKGRKLMVPVLYSAHCSSWKDTSDFTYPQKASNEFMLAESHDPDAFVAIADGESMIGSNIVPGDLLLVEPNHKVKNGDVTLVVSKKALIWAVVTVLTIFLFKSELKDLLSQSEELTVFGVSVKTSKKEVNQLTTA